MSDEGRLPGDSETKAFPFRERLVMLVIVSRSDGTCERLQSSRDLAKEVLSRQSQRAWIKVTDAQITDRWGEP